MITEEGTIVRKRSFAQLPDELVADKRISANAVRVWARLDKYAGTDGRAFPSRDTLAADLGLSVSGVKRALAELVAAGWISREGRDGKSALTRLHERSTRVTGDPAPGSPVSRGRVTGEPRPGSPVTHKGDPRKETHEGITAPADADDGQGDELDLGIETPTRTANPVQVLVGAYADAVRARGGTASRSLLGSIGKAVKRLHGEGVPEPVLLAVVQQAAAKGRRDLDAILAAPNGPQTAYERHRVERDRMFARWEEIAQQIDGRHR